MASSGIRRGRVRQAEREWLVGRWRGTQGGVVSRAQLTTVGIDRFDVRNEVAAGRWRAIGRHTVVIGEVTESGRLWTALFETGGDPALDGASGLNGLGMTGYRLRTIDVSVGPGHKPARRPLRGVVVHRPYARGRVIRGPTGLPVVEPAVATIRAGQWAVSDRQAAFLLCLSMQQRMADPDAVRRVWSAVRRSPRRRFLDDVVPAVTDGVQALGELDFAGECRRRRLPEPTRQAVRALPGRVAFLDAEFDPYGFSVEIDGIHHLETAQAIGDMLRQNDVVILGTSVLRIPVIGFHLDRNPFMDQVQRMLESRGWARPR